MRHKYIKKQIQEYDIEEEEKIHKKIIIGILASNNSFYDKIIEIYILKILKYIDQNNLNIQIILLYDIDHKIPLSIPKENIFINKHKSSYTPGLFDKTVNFFKFIEAKYNYKYVFRTNLSSFINIDRLIEVINILPEKDIYCGFNGKYAGVKYISGAGIIMSKDNIKKVIKYKDIQQKYRFVDDVVIGMIIKNIYDLDSLLPDANILSEGKSRYEPLQYTYCKFQRDLNEDDLNKIYNEFVEGKYYHTRIKNPEKLPYNNPEKREMDLKIFKFLTDKFYN